jgi:hypothetical protein
MTPAFYTRIGLSQQSDWLGKILFTIEHIDELFRFRCSGYWVCFLHSMS